MVDIVFCYTNSELNIFCKDIESVGQINANFEQYSGEDLLEHRFTLSKDFYLYGKTSNYIISHINLVGVEIRKQ